MLRLIQSPGHRILTAYHEAAHAVVGYLYGWKIGDTSIEARDLDKQLASAGKTTIEIWKSQAIVRSTTYTDIPHHLRAVGVMIAGMVGEELSGQPINDRHAFQEDLRYAWLYAFLYLNPGADPSGAKSYSKSLNRYFETGRFHGALGNVVARQHLNVTRMLKEPLKHQTLRRLAEALLERESICADDVNALMEHLPAQSE